MCASMVVASLFGIPSSTILLPALLLNFTIVLNYYTKFYFNQPIEKDPVAANPVQVVTITSSHRRRQDPQLNKKWSNLAPST